MGHVDWDAFRLGFWHPFGQHAGEKPEDILARKAREIEATGWTLWSFQRRRFAPWITAIGKVAGPVYVLCGAGTGRDPAGTPHRCAWYRPADPVETAWEPIPGTIAVPHPFGRGPLASAFIVRRIIEAGGRPPFAVRWLRVGDGTWQDGAFFPTRGEYLIERRETGAALRAVSVVLELQPPFIAWITRDEPLARGHLAGRDDEEVPRLDYDGDAMKHPGPEPAPGRNTRSPACGMFLPRVPLIILVVGALLLAAVARVDAQASVFPLRIEWTAGPTDGKWQHLCGKLYNDTPRATSEVQLLVEGRDTSGRVIDSRRASVLGYISPWGRTYFCSTAAAGAAHYSVTIIGVQWGGGER